MHYSWSHFGLHWLDWSPSVRFRSCPWLWNPNKEGADSPCILVELSRTEKGFSQSLFFLPVILPFRCIRATVVGTLRTLTSSSHIIAHFPSLFAAMRSAVGLRVCAPSFRQSIWGFLVGAFLTKAELSSQDGTGSVWDCFRHVDCHVISCNIQHCSKFCRFIYDTYLSISIDIFYICIYLGPVHMFTEYIKICTSLTSESTTTNSSNTCSHMVLGPTPFSCILNNWL